LAVLNSPFRSIITRSFRPLLAIPGEASSMDHALLAYDGGPRAKEALFVSTYLAERWETHLTVFSALEGSRFTVEIQDYVHSYLELHEIDADYITVKGPVSEISDVIRDSGINLVLLGGYSRSALMGMVAGSTLDYMLRELPTPILVCR